MSEDQDTSSTSPEPQLLGRNDFIGASAVRYETATLPWDPTRAIRVRSLPDRVQSKYELENLSEDGSPNAERLQTAKRRLVALTMVDADGKTFLTEADVKAMEDTDGKLISFAFNLAQKHCNIEQASKEALVKN